MDELIDSKLAMSSSRVDRGKNMEVNESPKSLEERLSNCRQPPRQPFIYRVHKYYLRDSNDNAHEPHMLAIGPYHHGKQSLKIMEEHKLRYLKSLLLRKNHKVDRYLYAIAEIEEEVRSCYAEELSFSSTEFVEMLVLDGCFIIELSRKSWMHDQGDRGETSDDPIFQMEWWFLSHLTDDLILFENQIPFFVLCKLFDLIHEEDPTPKQQPLLIRWIFNLLQLKETNITKEEPVRHLLHLKHATERPSSLIYINLNECPPQREFHWIPSATELKDANVTFRNTSSSIPYEVDFSNGVLTMSTLKIHDDMDHDLRNLILYEQYFPSNRPTYVTDYVVLLDCLINSGQDVEILSQYGIIENLTGHYQVAADIINRLAQSVSPFPRYFIYAGTCSEINAHHKRPWNRARAHDSPKSLEERLSNCRQPPRLPFIYRVHKYYLRDSNDNAHEPHMVAIGPYHHGKQSLKIMEEHKLRYLKSLLIRKNHEVDVYISAIAEIEEEVRSCYAEELSFSSTELAEMLVLDGCFIIELSRKSWMRDPSCTSDPIFQLEWFLGHLTDDLILFENQIPFFVLCKLLGLINEEDQNPNQQQLLITWIFHLLELKGTTNNVITKEVMHLLYLKHATQRPSSPIYINLNKCPRQWKFRWIPTATELKDANVTFRNTSSSIPYELGFSNGVLTMSTLSIDDKMDQDMRNLILYEQYFPDNQPTYITDYMVLLDCLVNTGRDVEILSQYGIIKNVTGHNQVAADIINRLAKSVHVSPDYFIYANTFSKINAHHKRPWNRARAALSRDYFNTPWAYISFVAALLLLLLTVAQTVFSAIQL